MTTAINAAPEAISNLLTVAENTRRRRREWQKIPGCYATGDVAVKDRDGYTTVLGRVDDVLNVAGHRIGTSEVESALVSHPAVAEAAAIGIPDALKGDVIKAFVTVRTGHVASQQLATQLIEHVRRELGPIATPAACRVRRRAAEDEIRKDSAAGS